MLRCVERMSEPSEVVTAPAASSAFGAAPSINPPPPSDEPWRFRLKFSGQGGEYFRIWIVNLLLTVLTLGIYYPWARLRRMRYFYANTWVEGGSRTAPTERHALDYLAKPKQMVGATVIVSLAFLAYSIGSRFSPILAMFLGLAVAALTPWVQRAGLRFRLANTSWRGLRFGFSGTLAEVYRVYWPIAIPTLLFAAAVLLSSAGDTMSMGDDGGSMAEGSDGATGDAGDGDGASGNASPASRRAWWSSLSLAGGLMLASIVSGYLVLPWLWLRFARYRQTHYRFGSLHSGFVLTNRDVLRLVMRLIGVSLLAALVVFTLAGLGAWLLADSTSVIQAMPRKGPGKPLSPHWGIFMLLMLVGLGIAFRLVVLPYLWVQQQNVVWSATRSPHVMFRSRVSFGRMVRVDLVNWLLTIVTLGLYRPFAEVAMARLRIDAVSGAFRRDPAGVIGAERDRVSAVGDVGADLFDLGGAF